MPNKEEDILKELKELRDRLEKLEKEKGLTAMPYYLPPPYYPIYPYYPYYYYPYYPYPATYPLYISNCTGGD